MGEMDAYRDVFLEESSEYLDSITDGLLVLERSPHDLEPVETVFRGAHSLKGMSAAMEYSRTSDMTHRMESLMERVRSREIPVTTSLIDLMLAAVDQVRALIIDESAGGSSVDISESLAALDAAIDGEAVDSERLWDADAETLPRTPETHTLRARVKLEDACVLKAVRAYMVLKRMGHIGTVVDTVPSARDIEDERFGESFDIVIETQASPEEIRSAASAVTEVERVDVEEVERTELETPGASGEAASEDLQHVMRRRTVMPKISETQTVRIAIGHLDTMADLVGELFTLRARLDEVARGAESRELHDALADLHRVSGELRHEVMETRMVPVGNIFNRFPRMVRDLAHDLGKDVEFELSGLDIELDRTVLDEIGDPIVHLLRNSIDHGIETPEERSLVGKPGRGRIRLDATRERDTVRISVSDDGRGMNLDRIREEAFSRGLLSADDRDSCSPEELLSLACAPGFSTTAEATKVSGRGVGMDVVKGKIEYLGGVLSIDSSPGQGTTFTLTLPLTLAILQALLVGDGRQTYALPLAAVDEVIAPSELEIETVEGIPVALLRDGSVASLHRLDGLLGLSNPLEPPRSDEYVVLLDSGTGIRALAVRSLMGRTEIVIKPMSNVFRDVRGVGGATVLGDGSIALVLDPRTLFQTREES